MISATVMMASQVWRKVVNTQPKNSATLIRTMKAVSMQATRIAVPVASGWKTQTAA